MENNNIRNSRNLEGIYPAIVTPMSQNGEINYEQLHKLIDEQITAGVNGIVACGTTGQSANLRTGEHIDLAEDILNYIDGRTQCIIGAGSNDMAQSIDLMKSIEQRVGDTTFLLTTGYYNKKSPALLDFSSI